MNIKNGRTRIKPGFTLIEAIIMIVVTALLTFIFAVYIREGFQAWRYQSGQKNMALSTRTALNRIIRELKHINKNESLFSSSNQYEVSFYDVDGNIVTYESSGTNLLRNSEVLLENLQVPDGLSFTYLDENGMSTGNKADIRAIRCRLTAVKDDNKFVLESAAQLRVRGIQ